MSSNYVRKAKDNLPYFKVVDEKKLWKRDMEELEEYPKEVRKVVRKIKRNNRKKHCKVCGGTFTIFDGSSLKMSTLARYLGWSPQKGSFGRICTKCYLYKRLEKREAPLSLLPFRIHCWRRSNPDTFIRSSVTSFPENNTIPEWIEKVDVELLREPDNEYDEYALIIATKDGHKIGYLPSRISQWIAPEIDHGIAWNCRVIDPLMFSAFKYEGVSREDQLLLLPLARILWDMDLIETPPIQFGDISWGNNWMVFVRDHFTCIYCGRYPSPFDPVKLVTDHLIPKSYGGGDDLQNLVTSCQSCNGQKKDELLSFDASEEIERRIKENKELAEDQYPFLDFSN